MTGAAAIELYVGTAIEHASEREVLAALIEHLSSADEWAAIFANIHIGGRQLDFLVAHGSGCRGNDSLPQGQDRNSRQEPQRPVGHFRRIRLTAVGLVGCAPCLCGSWQCGVDSGCLRS